MKTIKLFFTATVVAIAAIATAVERPKMEVIPVTANRAIVAITNENPAYFEISVKTLRGDIVYYKQSKKQLTDFKKTFDFAQLENGAYVLNLKVNDTELSQRIQIESNKIAVGDSKLRIDPYFFYKEGTLKFSYLNVYEENFKVYIYKDGEFIFQKKLGRNVSIQNRFNLSNLSSGKYEVVLSSQNREYVYSLLK